MRAGRVIGKVVQSRTVPSFRHGRWLLISPFDKEQYQNPDDHRLSPEPSLVAYDELGAGEGQIVGFIEGTEATLPFAGPMPVDAYISVIFDRINYSETL